MICSSISSHPKPRHPMNATLHGHTLCSTAGAPPHKTPAGALFDVIWQQVVAAPAYFATSDVHALPCLMITTHLRHSPDDGPIAGTPAPHSKRYGRPDATRDDPRFLPLRTPTRTRAAFLDPSFATDVAKLCTTTASCHAVKSAVVWDRIAIDLSCL